MTLSAATIQASGVARPVRLHVPKGPTPGEGWPLLVLLDGDWVWPLPAAADEALRRCAVLMPGHGTPGPVSLARRALDYTPPAPDGETWPDPRVAEWTCGGAEAFLDTLLGPILGWAHTQAPLRKADPSLYGHSYGGLFALYALARCPGAFGHTICASPSLWWHAGRIEALLDELRELPLAHTLRLTLMVGSEEKWHHKPLDPVHPGERAGGVPTLPFVQALQTRLAGINALQCRLEVLEGIAHGEALQASARHAVMLAAHP